MNKKNAKTGAGLRANPAFGLGPKAAPRPSHGQARKALYIGLINNLTDYCSSGLHS